MIRRVYEQAQKSTRLDRVVIATDHSEIFEAARQFTKDVIMTSTAHKNGTARCAEVAAKIDSEHYLNIQGDEPFIAPSQIDLVCQALTQGSAIATLKKKINDWQDLQDPNLVKVVTDRTGNALYFSRSPIPYGKGLNQENWSGEQSYFKHIGLYGFAQPTLAEIVNLPPAELEITESLEQLRWLFHGYEIHVCETTAENIGIDVPADIDKALRIFQP